MIKEMAAIQKVLSNPGDLDQDQIDALARRFARLASAITYKLLLMAVVSQTIIWLPETLVS
jgi:hypothetical protein